MGGASSQQEAISSGVLAESKVIHGFSAVQGSGPNPPVQGSVVAVLWKAERCVVHLIRAV